MSSESSQPANRRLTPAAAVRTVAGKELSAFFNQPTAYIALIVFLSVALFLYFRAAFVNSEASLRGLFELLPWLLLFYVPAVTMRSFAEEKREGTLELLMTAPLTEAELVIGKFLGNHGFLSISLALTLPVVVTLMVGGHPDLGVIVAQYVGAFFLLSAMTAVGLLFSSLTRNQVVAFILALVVDFALLSIGLELVTGAVPFSIGNVLSHLSLATHFSAVSRGLLDSRDIVYFLALTAGLLFLTWYSLRRPKTVPGGDPRRYLEIGLALFLACLVVVDLISMRAFVRLDMTAGRIYSLSPASKEVLGGLKDVVNIELVRSSELPAQMGLVARSARDMLGEYELYGKGLVKVTVIDPGSSATNKSEAQDLGVPPVQFNVVSQDEYQVKQGYLGVGIRYGKAKEAIPFLQNTDDLEYKVTSAIYKLANPRRKTIVWLSGNGEKDPAKDCTALKGLLDERYTVKSVDLKKEPGGLAGASAAILAGPAQPLDAASGKAFKAYLAGGGAALMLVDKVNVMPQMMLAMAVPQGADELLPKGTLRVSPDLVLDPQSNENVTIGGGAVQYVVPYAFWLRASTPASGVPFGAGLERIILPWASSLAIGKDKGYTMTPLIESSPAAAVQTGQFNIDPGKAPKITGKTGRRVLAASMRGRKDGSRVVLIGDSDMVTDQFQGDGSDNLDFAMSSIDWLAQEKALSSISSKKTAVKAFRFSSVGQRETFKYLDLIGIPALVAAYGAWRIIKRQKRTRQVDEA